MTLRDVWQRTVGAWATEDGHASTLLAKLVDWKALTADEAKRSLSEARRRIELNRQELDQRVEESVSKAKSFFTPTPPLPDAAALEARIADLEQRLAALTVQR
jgi:polyhydroxyalkanoate synthesis regulator phasin